MTIIKKPELESLLVRGLYSKLKIKKVHQLYYLFLYSETGERFIYYKNDRDMKTYEKKENLIDWLRIKFNIEEIEIEE